MINKPVFFYGIMSFWNYNNHIGVSEIIHFVLKKYNTYFENVATKELYYIKLKTLILKVL